MLALVPLVVACGGAGDPFAGQDSDGGSVAVADGGAVIDNGGTVAFPVSQAFVVRGEWCGAPPPFTPQDPFDLVLYGEPQSQPMPWPTMDIVVYASAPVGSPQTLTVLPWKPGPAPAPGDNDVNEEDADGDVVGGNPLLALSLSRGLTPAAPDPNPYDEATMTVLAIPKKEGDSLRVRVQLHFTDGATLDQTFVSPPLAETDTPCGGVSGGSGP
ncbi:MAG TPA: hypothetical protein VGG39_33765 [Polyangiaceae bacterium]